MIVACGKCGTKNRINQDAVGGKQPVCGRCVAKLNTAATDTPLVTSDASFARDVLDAGRTPVLLDCWAPWCGPCRMIAPILDQLAAESGGRYRIAKLNVDENPQTAARFSVSSIPTLLVFKEGALVDRIVGAQPKSAIASRLAAHM